ncbi:MAG: hypothetical protein M1820_001950 [Bogoriella megaspora]|nr:MAG: hypothetical protein M1820_001950 [Bogoriella megaspora]
MSTRGQFNTKSPTIKRILKEASELSRHPSSDYHAEPLESDLFEWHFTLRGPPSPSHFAGGLYHGRITLPPTYPLRPPMFRFMTPSGRFEVNREICLSISGHHEESWQPAWGIRTALVAIRSFMDTGAKGQLGGLDASEGMRRKLAGESTGWRCTGCGRTNGEIMREREEVCREMEGEEGKEEEKVPEELKLAYREELGKGEDGKGVLEETVVESKEEAGASSAEASTAAFTPIKIPISEDQGAGQSAPQQSTSHGTQAPTPTRIVQARTPTMPAVARREPRSGEIEWIDKAIWGVVAALLLMVLRKFL